MKTITIRDIIGNGSNSNVYDVSSDDLPKASVAKCSKNHSNYVSFNLQYNASLKVINSITDPCVIIPNIYMYGYSQNLGEILVMEKVENICQLDFIINNSIGEGLLIIRTVATFIAHLHNVGISGYDIEFYWKLDSRQLVVLDIGPLDTFNCSSKAMICSHWHQENENPCGKWNLVSQILPIEQSKKIFAASLDNIKIEQVLEYINPESVYIHIQNVARIHALLLIAQIANPHQYLRIFISYYKKNINILSHDSITYLRYFKNTVLSNINEAEVCLYYSMANVLCKESCSVSLKRSVIWK